MKGLELRVEGSGIEDCARSILVVGMEWDWSFMIWYFGMGLG